MKRIFKLISITLVFLFVSVASSIFFFAKPPLLDDLSYSQVVYASDKHHLLRLTLSRDEKYRVYTPLTEIAPQMIAATLLEEDQYFRWHPGINPVALTKAIWQTYALHSRRMGASTITMQVARLRYGIKSTTWSGKLQQMLKAIQLESHYSKNQILEAYLNLAPYGNNIEGIGAASLIYFNKPAKELTLSEALALAVIPQNPTQRTPDQQTLKQARSQLYKRWIALHPADKNIQAILTLPLQMQSLHQLPFRAPHFVNSLLASVDGKKQQLVTTLDLRLQTLVELVSRRYLARKKSAGVNNAAVMLIDARDMSVQAALGSADFYNVTINGQINGLEIKRSPGSTLKPFIYGLALDQGIIHPATVLKDVPRSFGSYNPENFDNDFMGPLSAKDALVLSRNIPAVSLLQQLANPNLYQLLQMAHVTDLQSENYYGLGLALGGSALTMKELISLYAMLSNEGLWQPVRQLKDEKPYAGDRLLSPEASFLVLEMLKDEDQHRDTNVAWKTGTSSAYRDAWTVGIVGPYVLAVWVGNFNNTSNPAFVGKNIAAPLFFELVDAMRIQVGKLPKRISHPERLHLIKTDVCKASGMLPTRYCRDTISTWFIPGKSPIKTDTIYREVAIDKSTGLRTCHYDDNTRFEVYEFWPSDLLKIFKQAGITRRTPPPYQAGCAYTLAGLSPQITSPQTQLSYIVRMNHKQKSLVPFNATVDADVRAIYWFVNETFLAKTARDETYWWPAKVGRQVVRVIDDHGRSDARDIMVKMDG